MTSAHKPYLGFQAKVLIPVITIMTLLVVVTMSIVNRRIASQVEAQAKEQLEMSAETFKNFRAIREQSLLLQYRNLASEPRIKALFSIEDLQTLQKNADDVIQEFGGAEQLHVDAMLLTSAQMNQVPVARSSESNAFDVAAFKRNTAQSVARALNGEENTDTGMIGDRLFDVVSIPVLVGENVVGALTFALNIDSSIAHEFKRTAHCEVVFLADGRVVVSTVRKSNFNGQFANLFKEFASKPSRDPRQGELVSHVLLGRDHALSVIGSFPALNANEQIGYLLLTSYQEPLHKLGETQWMLLLISVAGILLSVLIILVIVGKITSPLRQLRASAEAIGRGDFSQRISIASRDECGQLADAFNRMIENLKSSREQLEKTVYTLKTTQEQLVQREKLSAIGQLVSGVAHELNNPLTSVIGFAQLAHNSAADPQQQRFLDRVVSEAQRCAKIVQSLLSFARQHPPERKLVSLNATIEAAVDILRYQLRTSGIEVITHFDPKLPKIMGDVHQLQQVFVNIINNARQAIESCRSNGVLKISTEQSQEVARILFEDNGPGITQESLNKIFDPFFTTKELGKGTGLGLSLSYGIVQQHAGNISARNNKESGATFIIELPVTRESAAEHDTEIYRLESAAVEGNGKRLLVIDDEDSILELTREILLTDHYRVEIARDGQSALRQIQQRHYDLVVCDMKMPDLNGEQVYQWLHASNPAAAARLIFMTGDVINDKTQEFFERNGKVCLAKPFTLDQFRAAVSKTFAKG